MLNLFAKTSYLYFILIPIVVIGSYNTQVSLTKSILNIFVTILLAYVFYLGVYALLTLTLRNRKNLLSKVVYTFVQCLAYFFIFSIVIGYFVGVTNWGTPVNYKLYFEIISNFKSSINTLINFSTSFIYILIFLIAFSCLVFYHLKKFKYFNRLSDHLITNGNISKLYIVPIVSILVFFLSCYIYPKSESQLLKNEIFTSFCTDLDPLQRSKSMKIGLNDLNPGLQKIENFDKKNIILFSVDCLRSDHLSFNYSRDTSPFLDSLYKAGKVAKFDISASTSSSSFYGILTTLNSKNVENLGYVKYGLQDYLKLQGYQNNFIVSGIHRSFYNLKKHYGKNIDYYVEGRTIEGYQNKDDFVLIEALKNIEPFQKDKPNFFFFHLMSAHILGPVHDQFQMFKPTMSKRLLRFNNNKNEDYKTLYTNTYDNGIFQADYVMKRITEVLDSKGYMDNSIVVVMGDHGESLGEKDAYGHGNSLNYSAMNIPILFIDNDANIYKENTFATQIDIAPTIISRLGIPTPKQWQGKDLTKNHKERITFHEQVPNGYLNPIISIFHKIDTAVLKYTLNSNNDNEELYHLNKDAGELNNLIDSYPNTDYYKQLIANYKDNKIENVDKQNSKVVSKDSLLYQTIGYCDFLSKRFTKKLLANNEMDILKNCQRYRNNNACSCSFTWIKEDGASPTFYVGVNKTINAKRRLNTLKKKGFSKANEIIKTKNRNLLKWTKNSNCYINVEEQKIKYASSNNYIITLEYKNLDYSINDIINMAQKIEVKFINQNKANSTLN